VYLVDTDVISAGSPWKAGPREALVRWMDEHSSELYLSVVTIAEIDSGIAKARRQRAGRKAADLTAWFETLLHLYAVRILAFDVAAARIAGGLSDLARSRGIAPGFADIVIAATAIAHDLIVLTRDTRHFEPLGVATSNPFEHLPPSNP
jgi:toxin FitB